MDDFTQRGRASLARHSDLIRQQTAAYLRNGGHIKQLPYGVMRDNPLAGRTHTTDTRTSIDTRGLLTIDKACRQMGITASKFRHGLRKGHLNGCPMPAMSDVKYRLYQPAVIADWVAQYGEQTARVEEGETA